MNSVKNVYTSPLKETWYFVGIIQESNGKFLKTSIYKVKYFLKVEEKDIQKINEFIKLKETSKIWNPNTDLLQDMTQCNVDILYSLSSMVISSKANNATIHKFTYEDPNLVAEDFERIVNMWVHTNEQHKLIESKIF